MKAKVELSKKDVEEAITEYLARQGLKVTHLKFEMANEYGQQDNVIGQVFSGATATTEIKYKGRDSDCG